MRGGEVLCKSTIYFSANDIMREDNCGVPSPLLRLLYENSTKTFSEFIENFKCFFTCINCVRCIVVRIPLSKRYFLYFRNTTAATTRIKMKLCLFDTRRYSTECDSKGKCSTQNVYFVFFFYLFQKTMIMLLCSLRHSSATCIFQCINLNDLSSWNVNASMPTECVWYNLFVVAENGWDAQRYLLSDSLWVKLLSATRVYIFSIHAIKLA